MVCFASSETPANSLGNKAAETVRVQQSEHHRLIPILSAHLPCENSSFMLKAIFDASRATSNATPMCQTPNSTRSVPAKSETKCSSLMPVVHSQPACLYTLHSCIPYRGPVPFRAPKSSPTDGECKSHGIKRLPISQTPNVTCSITAHPTLLSHAHIRPPHPSCADGLFSFQVTPTEMVSSSTTVPTSFPTSPTPPQVHSHPYSCHSVYCCAKANSQSPGLILAP